MNFTTTRLPNIRRGRLLGSKLRSLRKRNGMTLEDLSARCAQLDPRQSPSVSYLSMLETGKRTPSSEVLEMIGQVFGRTPEWFLDGNLENPPSTANVTSTASSRPNASAPLGPLQEATAFEPAFLFSLPMLRTALPELLLQAGMSGRDFSQLLIRVWQENQRNDFPEIERAAETAGQREMPLSLASLISICERHGLKIRWLEDDRRRLDRGLLRARFEAPGTILAARRLRTREQRLKYELAYLLGHKILHGGDGAIAPISGDLAEAAESPESATVGIGPRDALYAWRDFECGFFAGALLCPRAPFRRLLVRESHRIAIHKKLGVGPAVVMRRMTAVSPYRHWHFFDAYPPGYLRTVYRGNGIALPWGNLSLVPDPCPHWAVFRLLRGKPQSARTPTGSTSSPASPEPSSQLSIMYEGNRTRLYCCHSLITHDAADATRVLSVGLDLVPALEAQGYDATRLVNEIGEACQRSGGAAPVATSAVESLRTVSHVLKIAWVADALAHPARIICPRSRNCPREKRCN